MTHTAQVFNGALFVTHPFTPNAFIRVDVLQKRFADIVSECSLKALTLSAYPPTTQLIRLRLLFNQVRSLRFPHDEIFKREAERLGTPLDDQAYLIVEAATAAELQRHYLGVPF